MNGRNHGTNRDAERRSHRVVARRETMALGISGTYAVAENPDQLATALADPAGTLSARTAKGSVAPVRPR